MQITYKLCTYVRLESAGINHACLPLHPPPPPNFFLICGEINFYGRSNIHIFITTILLFHFKNSNQKSKVFLLKISSGKVSAPGVVTSRYPKIYLKKVVKKNFTFCAFELLPASLFKDVWPFVTAQHEWVK